MNVIVTGRNIELSDPLKKYAEEKVTRFDRYLSNITEAVVTLSVQKFRHKAEILLKVNGYLIQAEAQTEEIFSSLDQVTDKLHRQVNKYKEKLVSRRKGDSKQPLPQAAAEADDTGAVLEDTGSIIKVKQFDLKPMGPQEASMQMELLDKSFFVYTNESTGDINVIYRRNDGNYGLIEPRR